MGWRQTACRCNYADAGRNGKAEEQPNRPPQRKRHQGVGKLMRRNDHDECGDNDHGSDRRSFATIDLHLSSPLRHLFDD